MYAKTYSVIDLLANASTEYVTSTGLGRLLGTSTRQILRYIKEAQEYSGEYGYEILSFKGRGYQLKITDEEAYQKFVNEYGESQAQLPEENLMKEVVRRILLSDSCKMDDLAELFGYSRSSMSRVTAAAGSYLELFGLQMVSKAYTGLYIQGNEISIRDCMYHLFQNCATVEELWEQLDIREAECGDIRRWCKNCLEREQITARPREEQQFLTYLAITIKRISLNKEIVFGYLANLDGLERFKEQMTRMEALLERYFPLRELKGEYVYLTLIWMQIFGKKWHASQIGEHDMMFFHGLIRKAMKKIMDNYGVDLSGDEVLVNGLILHVASSYGKYLTRMESENPFYEELQKIYPTAYYYSIELAECISEYTKIRMPENELGFLTMHFASCLERNYKGKVYRTAILENSTLGTSLLLKSRMEKTYEELEVLGTYAYDDSGQIPKDVDFYISVTPVDKPKIYGHEVLVLSPFLNGTDQNRLNLMIGKQKNRVSMESVCRKDCFFLWEKPVKKKALLEELCERLVAQKRMTKEEGQAVLAREKLVSTEIASNAALPHGLIEGESFLAFTILKTPVMWGKARVKLVILGCFQKGDTHIKEILERLFQVISVEEQVNRLVSCNCYEEFITCLKELDGGYLC